MQSAALLFSKIGAVFGAKGAGAAITGSSIASTALTTFSAVAAASMQASVARNAAAVEEANAKAARERGQIEAQDRDFEAAAVLSQLRASQGGSGLSVQSGSFVRSRARQRVVSRTNRLRTIYDAELQAVNAENRAASARSEASQFKVKNAFNVFGGLTNLGTDLLTGEAANQNANIGSLTRRRITI